MFENLDRFLLNKSNAVVLTMGGVLLFLISGLDILSGRYFQIDLFYLLPIFLIAWFVDRKWGVVTAVLSALLWAGIDKWTGQISPSLFMGIWNFFTEMTFFLVFAIMLSALKQDTLKLNEMAHLDELTGVANRRSFYNSAEGEINRAQRFGGVFSVVYVDVDDFKKINDTHGHIAGDILLKEVAETIRVNIRNVDIVARLGGDEFAILFPQTSADEAKCVLQKIQDRLAQFAVRRNGSTTFSMGVVTFSNPPASVEEMIDFADKVMYRVKTQGKNSAAFESWQGGVTPLKQK